MTRSVPVCLFLLLCSAVQASKQPSDVIARYVAWRGGAAFEALHSVHERGELAVGALRGPFELWRLADGSSRTDAHLGPLSIQQANTSDSGWNSNTSAQIEDLGALDTQRARRSNGLSFANLPGSRRTLLASEQREGRTWEVVRVTFGDPDTYDLFIAPDTGELLGERITQDNKTRFVRFSDWRVVDGVRMPFREEQTGSNPTDHQIQRARTIAVNQPAAQSLFARPADRRIWSFAAGTHSTGWLDFNFYHDDRIFIPATANGHPVELLLDSGAGITLADASFAHSIALASTGSMAVTGAGGETSLQLASGLDVRLGALSLLHLTAGIMDLSSVSSMLGHPMPLILGKEAFNQLIIDIDFRRHRVAFYDPDTFTAPEGATRIALAHHGDQRTINLSIEDHAAAEFDFDIGNDSAVIIYPSYRTQEQLLQGRRQSQALIGGVGGMHKEEVASLRSVSIAGTRLADVPADFPEAGDNAVNYSQTAGNVGLGVFSRFRLITDYPHNALWLVPDALTTTEPFARNRAGVLAMPQSNLLHVLMIAPGSPAQAAGWKEGDDIVAIDGHNIDSNFGASALSHWAERPAGTTVTLTLADGSSRLLTLADYY